MLEYKEYLYTVYQERSFSRAAEKLYVSQPWLSSTVRKVERKIGTPLFDRTTNPLSLTEAGRYYIEQIEQIMTIEEEMRRYFQALKAGEGKTLHVGSSMFFCTYVLPSLLAGFRDFYPQITLTFSEGSSQTLQQRLIKGELDFVLEAEEPASAQIRSIPWVSEEVILAVPAGYEINKRLSEYGYTFDQFLRRGQNGLCRPPVPLEAFRNESFLLLSEGNDIRLRSLSLCRNAGFVPSPAMYLAQMMTAYYLVCEGRGITFLRSTIPQFVSPTESVIFYQLDDPLAVRSIYLSYPKRQLTAVQQHLLDFMRENDRLDKIQPIG